MMVEKILHARQSDGLVVIYNGADDVIDDPLADLTRVHFHSNLAYVSVVKKITGSFPLPSMSTQTGRSVNHTLAAHNMGFKPFVFGRLLNVDSGPDGTVTYPWVGSVPVQWARDPGDGDYQNGGSRWLALGADDTNLRANEIAAVPLISNSLPAITVNYEVFVTDLVLEGTAPALSNIALKIAADEFTAQQGLFKTTKQFLQKTGNQTNFVLSGGKTIDMVLGDGGAAIDDTHLALRYSLNGQTRQVDFGRSGFFDAPNQTSTFVGDAQDVSI